MQRRESFVRTHDLRRGDHGTAAAVAVAAGERQIEEIVIVADSREPVTPCGACRQVLAEFGGDILVHSENLEGARFVATVTELLPRAKEGILG